MADCKTQFVSNVEESLVTLLNTEQREAVIDEIIKALKGYDITKSETALVTYEGADEAILKRFCACLIIGGKSEKTIAQYKRTAIKLMRTVQKHYTEMTVYDIRMFLAYEKQRGLSNRTLDTTRAHISAFFQWMTREELIPKNPCMCIDVIKYEDKVRLPLSAVEIDALRMACKNEKERAIVELLLASGLRVSELTDLKTKDIDFNTMSVHVKKGKGNKERTTYINDVARTHIRKYLLSRKTAGEYLFYNKKGSPLNPGGVRHILNTLAERAGVSNVHPHRFRRTFASGLASRGMDIQEIRLLLGHTNLNTTLEYVYTSDDKVQNSYRRFIA